MMRFDEAIDLYIADMEAQARLNSRSSVVGYRATLVAHGEDVGNRDPAYVGREDVKRTLRRWKHANTQGTNRSKLVSFYAWTMEEGLRKDNPAQQTRRPRRRPTAKSRLTEAEVRGILEAASSRRERRAIFLGACAGLRNAELRGLQGRHFARDGVVWVSCDIAKGARERTVPVTLDLVGVVEEIRANVAVDEYVLPAQRFRNPPATPSGKSCSFRHRRRRPSLHWLRGRGHAGVAAHITPHDLRHAYAEHVARKADTRVAQHLLGHAHLGTTDAYLGLPRLDDMVAAVRNATYGIRTNVLGVPQKALTARRGDDRNRTGVFVRSPPLHTTDNSSGGGVAQVRLCSPHCTGAAPSAEREPRRRRALGRERGQADEHDDGLDDEHCATEQMRSHAACIGAERARLEPGQRMFCRGRRGRG